MRSRRPPPDLDRLLDEGLRRHQAGDLQQAEKLYRQALEQAPEHGDALHLLGVVAYQMRDYDTAVELARHAIRANPRAAMYYNTLGLALQERGELDQAAAAFQRALALATDFVEALSNLGNVHRAQGRIEQARECYRRALALRPDFAEAHVSLGKLLEAEGHSEEALSCYHRALDLDPRSADAHDSLGRLLALQNQLEEAVACHRRALALRPDFAEAHGNLGNVLQKQGKLEEALERYQRALALKPGLAGAHVNIANLLVELGRPAEAAEHYRQTLEREPSSAPAHNGLGIALRDLGRYTEAIEHFQRALDIDPGLVDAHSNLGDVLQEQGEVEMAEASYRRALEIAPTDAVRVKLTTLLPVIADSVDEILGWRRRLDQGLAALARAGVRLADPLREVGRANFYLAYHGLNNRELQTRIARVYETACPDLLWTAPHCRRPRRRDEPIRVGFISKYLRRHSIGKTTRGLIARLSRERFRAYALFVPPLVDDEVSRSIRSHTDETVMLPATLAAARQRIAELKLDVLFYQDIGMEPFTYYLAFARLAPVQCVSFGHPDTTGIGNMDYFVSNDLFEIEGAQDHYSERLFLLHNLGTLAHYYRPQLPNPLKGREAFRLPADAHLYICPQTLFKFHPEFDPILAAILRADPAGRLVLIEGKFRAWTERLKRRFQRAMPDVMDRITFLPSQTQDDFLNLLALADVMLDTPHFNGMNSNLEAFSVGTPVVTLPKDLQRGRHTLGMYRRMGIDDCIARTPEQYAEIAVRIGADPAYRETLRRRILAANAVLYEDMEVVHEFERFFVEAHSRAADRC